MKNECEIHYNGTKRYVLKFFKSSQWLEFSTTIEKAFEAWKNELSKYCIQNEFSTKFNIEKPLGEGAFGTVYLVERHNTKEMFAAKAFSKAKMKREADRLLLKNEIRIMRKLDHENIMKVYEVHETSEYIHVILEYIKDGELSRYLRKNKKLSRKTMRSILSQLFSILVYLEEIGIIHRDIKPENILVVEEDKEPRLKLGDFGLACELESGDFSQTGTPGYMAPEVINYKKYHKSLQLSHKIDIYSVGCIMYEM